MPAHRRLTIAWKLILVAGLAMGLLLIAAAVAVSSHTDAMVSKLTQQYAGAVAQDAAQQVKTEINAAAAAAGSLRGTIASAHEAGLADRDAYRALVKPDALTAETVEGAWFAAEPNALPKVVAAKDADAIAATGLTPSADEPFAVHWIKQGGASVLAPEAALSGLAQSAYAQTVRSGKPVLTEPAIATLDGRQVVTTLMALPVSSGGKLIGAAGLDLSLDRLSTTLGALHPLEGGRVMLVSAGGQWLAHPDPNLRLRAYADKGADALSAVLAGGPEAQIDGIVEGDTPMIRVVRPIAIPTFDTTWALVMDVPAAAITGPADRLARLLLAGGVLITVAVLAALFIASRAMVRKPLAGLSRSVETLSAGRYDQPVSGTEGGDEIGDVARALEGFRHDLADGQRRRSQQDAERAKADLERERQLQASEAFAETQVKAVAALGEGVERLADGDLIWRMRETDFAPDDRAMPRDFNAAVESLQATMAGILDAARSIREGCAEIGAAADDLSHRTERQATGLEQTAAALSQITSTVKRSAEGADRARQVTLSAKANAQRSGAVVKEAVEAMGGIERSSNEITNIIGVIDQIAFQTNLLALNAGVEAARAGDAGRGFAVVAQEVRALAQRSADAAREIKALIRASTEQVGKGVRLVGETGETLDQILVQVAEIDNLVGDIAASSQEQAAGLAQVSQAVNRMDQATQQNVTMVEQSTAATHALSNEAAELERLVSRFQIGAEIHALRPQALAHARPDARPQAARPTAAAPTRESFRQRYVQGANALKVAPASRPGAWEEF